MIIGRRLFGYRALLPIRARDVNHRPRTLGTETVADRIGIAVAIAIAKATTIKDRGKNNFRISNVLLTLRVRLSSRGA
jgi:hypothetical protein